MDPVCEVRPAKTQVDDLLGESRTVIARGHRVLVTTLTKRMSEDLTEYLHEQGLKVRYLHSDIDTLERIEIVRDLRLGVFDILVGINLLREGIDIPECGLVAILDADKEGFLRSETSLVQTIGRAARNLEGRVLLYADRMTGSLERALAETERRRTKQAEHNRIHKITPASIRKAVQDVLRDVYGEGGKSAAAARQSGSYAAAPAAAMLEAAEEGARHGDNLQRTIAAMRKQMHAAAGELEFEKAASLRDDLKKLADAPAPLPPDLAISDDPFARQSCPAHRRTPGTGTANHPRAPPPPRDQAGHGFKNILSFLPLAFTLRQSEKTFPLLFFAVSTIIELGLFFWTKSPPSKSHRPVTKSRLLKPSSKCKNIGSSLFI